MTMIDQEIKEEFEKETNIEKKIKEDLEVVIEMSKPILVFDYKNQQCGMNSPSISALGNYQGQHRYHQTISRRHV